MALPKPDLTFGEPQPQVSNSTIFEDGWVHFIVVVENNGESAAQDVNVDLFKNESGQPVLGDRGQMTHVIENIEPGQKIKIDYIYKMAESGFFQVFFVIDPENEISESNENNNISSGLDLNVDTELAEDNQEAVAPDVENDSPETPKVIGKNFGPAKLALKDDDYYRVHIGGGEFFRVKMLYDAYIAPMDLYLYNPSGDLIASSENRGDQEEIALVAPQSGNYLLEIKKLGANDSSYLLDLKARRMSDLKLEIVSTTVSELTDKPDPIEYQNLNGSEIDGDTTKYLVDIHVKVMDTTATPYVSWRTNCSDDDSTLWSFQDPCTEPDAIYPPTFDVNLFVNRTTLPRLGETGAQDPITVTKATFKTSEEHDPENNDDEGKYGDNFTQYFRKNEAEITFHIIVGPGDYTFSAIADTSNVIPEISESNNVSQLYYRRIAGETPVDMFEDEDDIFPGPLLAQGDYPKLSCWDSMEYFHVDVPPSKRLQVTIDYIQTGDDLILYHLGNDEDGFQYILGSSDTGLNRESISVYNATQETRRHYFYVSGKPEQYDSLDHLVWSYYATAYYNLKIALTNEFDHDAAINTLNYTPLFPSYGDTVFIQAQVENRGTQPLENLTLDLFMLPESRVSVTQDDSPVQYEVIEALAPGEKKLIEFSVPVADVSYNLFGVLDRDNAVAEIDKDNNVFGPVHLSMDAADREINTEDGSYYDDTLEISATSYVDELNQSFDTNDVWQTAVPIEEGSYNNLVLADKDWYKVQLGAYQWISAKVNFIPGIGDIDLLVGRTVEVPLFDENGNPVDENGEIIPEDGSVEQATMTRFTTLRYAGNLGDSELIQYFNDSASPLEIYLAVLPLDQAFDDYSLELVSLDGNANGLADLVIDSFITVPSPVTSMIYGDEVISTTVSVKNIGSWITTNSTTLELYYSSAPRAGEFGDLYQIVPVGLLPGETRYYTFEYSLPGGSYPLHFAVDPGNRVNESNEENNEVSAPYNLVIQGGQSGNIALSLSDTQLNSTERTVSANVTVHNTTYNTDFYLKFRLVGGPDDRVVYEWNPVWFQDRYTSGTSTYHYSFTFDRYLVNGNVKLEVIADWGNRVGEDNENDNSVVSAAKLHHSPVSNFSIHTFGSDSAPVDTVMEIYRYSASGYAFSNGVVDPDQLVLVRTIDDRNGVFAADTIGLFGGQYFIRIYGYGSSTGDYYIASDQAYSDWTADAAMPVDTSENDDTPGEANFLYANQPQRKTISGWHDEDWYRFKMESIKVEFSPLLAADVISATSVKLYRDTGDPARPLEEVLADELDEIGFQQAGTSFYIQGTLQPGRYFISVTGPAEAGDYGVVYNSSSMEPVAGVGLHDPNGIYEADTNETNNSPAEATPLAPGAGTLSNLIGVNDTDWYYIEAGL